MVVCGGVVDVCLEPGIRTREIHRRLCSSVGLKGFLVVRMDGVG